MKYLAIICAVAMFSTALCQDKPTTETPVRPDTLALFGVSPLGDSSVSVFFDEHSGKLQNMGWKRVREWSVVAGCSVLVALHYETPDSSLHIYYENPDTLIVRLQTLFIK